MSDPEHTDPNEWPIRHESLPLDLLELIRSIYEVVGPYLDTTMEDFRAGFMRYAKPEHEVAIWCNIVAAWDDYHEAFLGGELQSLEDETKLLAALHVLSMGIRDEEDLGVLKEVGQRLLDCYAGL